MKRFFAFGCGLFFLLLGATSHAQNPENWTADQLLSPAALANTLRDNKEVPTVISVGPGAVIPGSIDVGMASKDEGLKKLKAELDKLPKDAPVVVYCGCCPFEHCPNVRPAIALLQELKFTKYYLLNLPKNIKTDWIDKGYPTAKQ